ncbi:hypothetical protein MF672_023510 [Actinomadura sp. ATCC 31491]|uniref:Uncharacterized protein n=1 Tax=Actinomadura luzonensis TaxID=2805427 RepID=A0ABT0FWM6_9ACTN|nr:hypothetical protein [Actinomadura luzonensis]MCK2216744.1 hypothetical protein [Actinomadura luzonensis]
MTKRSRKRRVLTGGALGRRLGFGPGEPHGPDGGDLPPDDRPGGDGGVREPRRPKPAPPSLAAEAPLPEPGLVARDRTLPPPAEVTGAVASR